MGRPPVITPIMAAPHFDRPMYQALNDYSNDWLVPGLGLLPADDFVTVLSTNSEFMEAFFVGLSDEMGRELLWRQYPTDQRGTYFRRFWDAQADELTQQIHAFSRTALSTHVSVGGTGGSGPRAVIVVKSELVRRYPDLIIQAVRNQGTVDDPVFEKVGSPQQTAEQLFAAHLEPDVALIGVDLSIAELDQPEWWIVIAEHPTATRFDRPRDDRCPRARSSSPSRPPRTAPPSPTTRLHRAGPGRVPGHGPHRDGRLSMPVETPESCSRRATAQPRSSNAARGWSPASADRARRAEIARIDGRAR